MNQTTIPQQLVEQAARGNCVLILGPHAGDGTGMDALAQALASECGYPLGKSDRSLPAVARYYQAIKGDGNRQIGRQRLVARLREWLERAGSGIAPLHRAVARLSVTRIVDLGYDNCVETALHEAGRPRALVVLDHELPYANRSQVLLVKPYGIAHRPESLVLTEEDHDLFVRNHPLLADQLRVWAATQVLLWVGVDPTDFYWQRMHQEMTGGLNPHHRREYALVVDAPPLQRLETTPAREPHPVDKDTLAIESIGKPLQGFVKAWSEQGVTPLAVPNPAAWLGQLTQAVADLLPLPADTLPGPGPLLGRRPYKFLDYYTAEDADLFFGREEWTKKLAARILAQPLLVLFGRSGVGKTSLLRAGVLPRLSEGTDGRDCWPIYARPGDDPLAAIRAAAEAKLDQADRATLADVAELGAFIQVAGERVGQVPVVVLDQAEECFTALSRPVRERWVAALAHTLQHTPGDARWVLSLREDFAAELHEWAGQVPRLFDHTERLVPLTRDEAREAIARPPQRVGAVIEDALVERLLDDLELDDVAPAQLQIVCDRLYQARDGEGRMTLAAYEALGTTRRILAEYVDTCLAQLPRQRRELAVALLKAMVTGRETKLPLRLDEILGGVAGDAEEKQAVLAGLVDARLVRSLEREGEPRYELAHEVLVEKVRSWIDEIEQAAKTARDLLRQERATWERLHVLPEREKVAYIHAQRENVYLHLDADDLTLMLHAALSEGLAPDYWANRAAESGLEIWPILAPALEAPDERTRIHALWVLTGWPTPQALQALQAGMADPSPRTRVAAHQVLYVVGSLQALDILDTSDDLRLVPAGEFIIGKGNEKHSVYLDAYFAEKYPVTNARYADFIEAGGYQREQYWTRAGWQWARRVGRAQPAFWEIEKWNQPGYPVVGLTWHEARAYACWAGRRLLTEAEWEKAARGTDGREYPWGEGFDKDKCNTKESGIRHMTPVGKFSPAGGDSPYGCVDMAGNVLEWTSSLYKPYPYQADDGREDADAPNRRVLRGGSWPDVFEHAHCAYRSGSNLFNANVVLGVRCGAGSVPSHSPPT